VSLPILNTHESFQGLCMYTGLIMCVFAVFLFYDLTLTALGNLYTTQNSLLCNGLQSQLISSLLIFSLNHGD